MDPSLSPPMAPRSPSSSSSSSSFDESYFFKTYVPLSNLPTPPLSAGLDSSSGQSSTERLVPVGEFLHPDLLGPAIHLTNLIPPSTSLTPASVPLAHALLTRADLPPETIALAVSILDSLNSRFALAWRRACPLLTPCIPLFPSQEFEETQHIDSIQPELIILSAIILSVKFVDDAQESTLQYCLEWGKGMWSCEQINYTQRTILENIGYRLLPLWEDSIILDALRDMDRAGRQNQNADPQIWDEDWEADTCFGIFGRVQKGMSDGKAVMSLGDQLTPAETPMVENVRGTMDVSSETRKAFSGLRREKKFSPLPDETIRGIRQPFPLFADSIMDGMPF